MKSKSGTIEAIQSLIKENDFFIKKKFGQNFITDTNVLTSIVNVAEIEDCDVIEIGPGLGSLTCHLLEHAHSVVAYEVDDDLIPILKDLFKEYDNFTLRDDIYTEMDYGDLESYYEDEILETEKDIFLIHF